MFRNGEVQENVGYTTVYVDYGKRTKQSLVAYGIALELFALLMLIVQFTAPDIGLNGTTLQSLEWLLGIVGSIVGMIFYLIEAVWSIIKECNKFRIIKLVSVIAAAVVLALVGIRETTVCKLVWLTVYLLLGVVEFIAVARYISYKDFE